MATQLVVCIIQNDDEDALREKLVRAGLAYTKISSTGGFLRKGNTTLMLGVEQERLEELVQIITQTCHARQQLVNPYLLCEYDSYVAEPIEVEVGGAVIFVLDIKRTIRA